APYYCVAAVIATMIAAPTLYTTISTVFSKVGEIPYREHPNLPVTSILDLGLRPFSHLVRAEPTYFDYEGAPEDRPPKWETPTGGPVVWKIITDDPYSYRAIFFGFVFFVAALAGSIGILLGAYKGSGGTWRTGAIRALAIGFLAALALVFLPHS